MGRFMGGWMEGWVNGLVNGCNLPRHPDVIPVIPTSSLHHPQSPIYPPTRGTPQLSKNSVTLERIKIF